MTTNDNRSPTPVTDRLRHIMGQPLREVPWASRLVEELDLDPMSATLGDAIAERLMMGAAGAVPISESQVAAIRELLNRCEGKVAQGVRLEQAPDTKGGDGSAPPWMDDLTRDDDAG